MAKYTVKVSAGVLTKKVYWVVDNEVFHKAEYYDRVSYVIPRGS